MKKWSQSFSNFNAKLHFSISRGFTWLERKKRRTAKIQNKIRIFEKYTESLRIRNQKVSGRQPRRNPTLETQLTSVDEVNLVESSLEVQLQLAIHV